MFSRKSIFSGLEAKPKAHSGTTFSGLEGEAGKLTAAQLSAVWRRSRKAYSGTTFSGLEAKPESSQRYNFQRSGGEAGKLTAAQLSAVWRRSRKAHSGTTFRGLEGEAGKLTAVQLSAVWRRSRKLTAAQLSGGGMEGRSPSICAAGAPPHPKPSKFPAHSAPERAVAVLCLNKINFRVH
jgi:hypothetical protein